MTTEVLTPPSISWHDYYELCKPKVVLLLLLTAVVGMHLAVPGLVPLDLLVFASLGIGLAAASAAAVNHCVDRRIDSIMARTHKRPLPQGKVSTQNAVIFAAVLCVISMFILYVFVNPLTALLTFLSLIGYAVVYTMFLKRATPQNIVIGGLAGAMPPLLGWVAVADYHPYSLLLVLIIYTWTPPHFWALAIHRQADYANAKVPMLPVTHGVEYTKTNIIFYTILMIIASGFPYLLGMSGLVYLISVLVLNAIFVYHVWDLKFGTDVKRPIKTFGFSITYLMCLFIALLVDHYIVW